MASKCRARIPSFPSSAGRPKSTLDGSPDRTTRQITRASFRIPAPTTGLGTSPVVRNPVYAKLPVPENEVHCPDPKNRGPKAKALHEFLFPDRSIHAR